MVWKGLDPLGFKGLVNGQKTMVNGVLAAARLDGLIVFCVFRGLIAYRFDVGVEALEEGFEIVIDGAGLVFWNEISLGGFLEEAESFDEGSTGVITVFLVLLVVKSSIAFGDVCSDGIRSADYLGADGILVELSPLRDNIPE